MSGLGAHSNISACHQPSDTHLQKPPPGVFFGALPASAAAKPAPTVATPGAVPAAAAPQREEAAAGGQVEEAAASAPPRANALSISARPRWSSSRAWSTASSEGIALPSGGGACGGWDEEEEHGAAAAAGGGGALSLRRGLPHFRQKFESSMYLLAQCGQRESWIRPSRTRARWVSSTSLSSASVASSRPSAGMGNGAERARAASSSPNPAGEGRGGKTSSAGDPATIVVESPPNGIGEMRSPIQSASCK